MNIKVNNKEMIVPEGSSLSQLSQTLNLPEKGVAIAVNNQMIPRQKAACGG